jgi:predicted transcriptional regulator of viral defense system
MNNIASYIKNKIDRLEPGKIILFNDLIVPNNQRMAMAKVMSRLVQKGIINRLERGKYYKPRKTVFGILKPSEDEILKALLLKNNGYLTGTGAFNQLGLTSQVTSTIVLAVQDFRPPKEVGGLKIKFRKTPIKVTDKNKTVLQLLDALRYIKKIPDSTVEEALKGIINQLQKLTSDEKNIMLQSALKYNPAIRALTGAIFELTCPMFSTDKLFRSLNPLSHYKIGISNDILPNKTKWKIK